VEPQGRAAVREPGIVTSLMGAFLCMIQSGRSRLETLAYALLAGFLVAWIWFQAELFRLAFVTYRATLRLGWSDQAQLVLLIMAFAVLTLSSCFGEDTMEKPYNAIPYYALWGVLLRIAYRVRAATAGVAVSSAAMTPARSMP
jgi:hypothetical protein